MAPKRGMSAEDKRKTILNIFHETKDVFVLKDVEKIGAKRGVVLQAIKEVLQSLVDDDLVHQERIGISNYFWSFPSETSVKLRGDLEKLQGRLARAEADRKALEARVSEAAEGECDAERRLELGRELSATRASAASVAAQLSAHSANDPERYDALLDAEPVAVSAANRWLDNLQILKSWLRRRFQGNEAQVDELFREHGLGDEDDYLPIPKARETRKAAAPEDPAPRPGPRPALEPAPEQALTA